MSVKPTQKRVQLKPYQNHKGNLNQLINEFRHKLNPKTQIVAVKYLDDGEMVRGIHGRSSRRSRKEIES